MTNTDEYYIYVHINLVTNEVFYVGKGSGNRAGKKTRRSALWNNIVNKYGYDILLIDENLTEDQAFELEKYYIKKFGRRDLGLGTLANHTDGGEGCSNHSEEARLKKSEATRGENNPFYGKKHTEEAKALLRDARKKQVFSEETIQKFRDKKVSDETRMKMSLASKGKPAHNKGIPWTEERRLKFNNTIKNKQNDK